MKNNEIVLNVGFEATSGLKLGNDYIEFRARFGGVARDIVVPVDHVVAIYARENGQGMAFPAPSTDAAGGSQQPTAIEGRPDTVARGLRLASSEDQPLPRRRSGHRAEASVAPATARLKSRHHPTPRRRRVRRSSG